MIEWIYHRSICRKPWEGRFGRENQALYFECVTFEVPIRRPGEDVCAELRERTYLFDLLCVWMEVKARRMVETA